MLKNLVFTRESGPRPEPLVNKGVINLKRLHFDKLIFGDKVLWVIIAILAIISVLVVFSSTAKMAYDISHTNSSWWYLMMQMAFLSASMLALVFLHRYGVDRYGDFSLWILITCLLLTGLTYFIGSTTNGAARWLPLGPIRIQPSEALKIALVLYLSKIIAVKQTRVHQIVLIPIFMKLTKAKRMQIFLNNTLYIVLPIYASVAVILFAHTSSAVLLFLVSMLILLIAGFKKIEILKVVFIAFIFAMLFTLIGLGRSSTATGRFSTWIESWSDNRTEIRVDNLSDTERSMVAIHNGEILGKGAGQSDMRVEMIHPESDYAFAFFVEEYGLILSVVLLLLYLWIFFRSMWIYERAKEPFHQLLVINLALLIVVQALLHVMVAVNLLPETGQNLPLVSRGGSAMFCTYMAFMMILSVSAKNDEQAKIKSSLGGSQRAK